jgi:hypothetical protein
VAPIGIPYYTIQNLGFSSWEDLLEVVWLHANATTSGDVVSIKNDTMKDKKEPYLQDSVPTLQSQPFSRPF